MLSTRAVGVLLALGALACNGELSSGDVVDEGDASPGPGDGWVPPDEVPDWSIVIDTTATDSFVSPTAEFHRVSGFARSEHGIESLSVGGSAVVPGAGGQFDVDVPVRRGLQLVEIQAADGASPPNSRRGNVSLLSADFLPEGDLNPVAAALTLTDEIVAAVAEPLHGVVADIDVAQSIMGRPVLSEDDTCVTRPVAARHDTPEIELSVSPTGALVMEVIIPNLVVEFDGTCTVYFDVDIVGSWRTDVRVRSTLSAPPQNSCLRGLSGAPVQVELTDFELDVDGDSFFDSIMVSLFGEISEGETAERLKAAFAEEANAMLGPALEDMPVFESSQPMTLFDVPLTMELCATGLATEGTSLRAIVGARVRGPGGHDAPGAPVVPGDLPSGGQGGFWLDANLVSQLLMSAWSGGGLSSHGMAEIELSTLAMIEPELREMYPEGTIVGVSLDGQLPPLVSGATTDTGDLVLEIGDLHLILFVGGATLFRVGTQLTLTLELVPAGGSALRPEVVDVDSEAWVLEEPVVDIDDEALAEAVKLQISSMAGDLLGDVVIELPEIGGALVPTDATTTEGGRYVHVTLD